MKIKPPFKSLAALAAGLLITATGQADQIVLVTLDTAPLTTSAAAPAAPFSLAFQLVQGSEPDNNTATIYDLAYGAGGSAGSSCPAVLLPCTYGGASGDIGSTVSLSATSPFNALVEEFTPGSSLSFLLDLTTNVDIGGTPDAFAFSILDADGGSIPTLDPSGADTLLTVDIDSDIPSFLTYATDGSRDTLGGTGPSITMDAPDIAPVAEPETLVLLFTGILFCWAFPLPGRKRTV